MLLLFTSPLRAEYRTQSFPQAHEIFVPLQADPTELHFAIQAGFPGGVHNIARVDIGDSLGIYRWALGDTGALQLNFGGAINTRFDATSTHSLEVVDFYGDVQLEMRIGPLSARSMFYHVSSHLGDDYLRENNIQSTDNSWEAMREIVSFQVFPSVRVYGGYTQAIHSKPDWSGLNAYQGGTEIYFNTIKLGFWHPYWANDFQAWSRTNYDLTWTSQLAFRAGDGFSRGRGITYFIQYMTGPRNEGQFSQNSETIWGIGLKFLLSEHLLLPTTVPEATIPDPEPKQP